MARFTSLLCCLLIMGALNALETPLVMSQIGNGGYVAMLNPNLGELRLYKNSGKALVELDTANVFTELYFYANVPHPQEMAYSRLRVGYNTTPSYMEMLSPRMLPDSRSREQGTPSLREQAVRGENNFWTNPPEYDGVVRGVFANIYLFLVVPSMRSIIVYELKNEKLELRAFRNYGPDLYLPGGMNTTPEPAALLAQLPREQREEWEERFKERMEEVAVNPETGIELKDLDPWVIAPKSNSYFVMLEPNVQRLLSYRVENGSLELKSTRNMEIDLMVPPEASFQTSPTPDQKYEAYLQEMKRAKLTPDTIDGLLARVETTKLPGVKQGDDSGIQADYDNKGYLIFDFTNKNKALVYDPTSGGTRISLLAVRDYNLDTGIAIHMEVIKRRSLGNQAYAAVEKMKTRDEEQLNAAMSLLKMALRYNPELYEDAEGNRKLKELREHADWQSTIEEAMKRKEELDAREEERKRLLEERRENRRN